MKWCNENYKYGRKIEFNLIINLNNYKMSFCSMKCAKFQLKKLYLI